MPASLRWVYTAAITATCLLVPEGRSDDLRGEFVRSDGRIKAISQTISDEIPLVIAAGGASGYLPEHTTESVAYAHAIGTDYIGLKVTLTKDGVAIAFDDASLTDFTNVAEVFAARAGPLSCCDLTLSELRQLQISAGPTETRRNRFPANLGRFQIATLQEQIQLIQGLNHSRRQKTGLYVEICNPARQQKAGLDPSPEVLRLLKKHGYATPEDRVFLMCADPQEVLRLRTELKCRLPLVQKLKGVPTPEEIAEVARVADGIAVSLSAAANETEGGVLQISHVAAVAHRHALMVHLYTLRTDDLSDQTQSVSELLNQVTENAGADGIFTDHPDSVLKWRTATHQSSPRRGPFHLLHGRGRKK